jgi:hypothetical protein
MKDRHHITKYNVEFNEYATLMGFDQRALYAKYYKGLGPRIKDALGFSGRPNTQNFVLKLKLLHYWEHRDKDRTEGESALDARHEALVIFRVKDLLVKAHGHGVFVNSTLYFVMWWSLIERFSSLCRIERLSSLCRGGGDWIWLTEGHL